MEHPPIKTQRQEFAEWLLGEGQGVHKVYMNEFDINIWTSRTKGRTPQGERAVRIVEGQRGQNFTIVLAISNLWGLIHHVSLEGGMTGDAFSDFCMEVSTLVY